MSFRRDELFLTRFGYPYRRGQRLGLKDIFNKVIRTGVKTTVEKGGELVGTALKSSFNPALQVLGHITTNASKGMAEAISDGPAERAEPVKAVNVQADVEQVAGTTGHQQQAGQIKSKISNKRKADTSVAPRKSNKRAKGLGTTKRRRSKKEAALWDIWNC